MEQSKKEDLTMIRSSDLEEVRRSDLEELENWRRNNWSPFSIVDIFDESFQMDDPDLREQSRYSFLQFDKIFNTKYGKDEAKRRADAIFEVLERFPFKGDDSERKSKRTELFLEFARITVNEMGKFKTKSFIEDLKQEKAVLEKAHRKLIGNLDTLENPLEKLSFESSTDYVTQYLREAADPVKNKQDSFSKIRYAIEQSYLEKKRKLKFAIDYLHSDLYIETKLNSSSSQSMIWMCRTIQKECEMTTVRIGELFGELLLHFGIFSERRLKKTKKEMTTEPTLEELEVTVVDRFVRSFGQAVWRYKNKYEN
jgi:hypothetical protein